MHRLFVAIDLPKEHRQLIHSICYGLQDARWVKPEQIHLTIRFIGEVDGAMFRDIKDILSEVRCEPFKLKIKGLGHFPPRRSPKVLWLGIDSCEKVSFLRNRVESALVKTGLEPERRKFSPHITIARFRNSPPAKKIAEYMVHQSLFETPDFEVTHFHLYSSFLGQKGALHQIEHSYSLSTPS